MCYPYHIQEQEYPAEARLIKWPDDRHRDADERQKPREHDRPSHHVDYDGPRADADPPRPRTHGCTFGGRGRVPEITSTTRRPSSPAGAADSLSVSGPEGAVRLPSFRTGNTSSLRSRPTATMRVRIGI